LLIPGSFVFPKLTDDPNGGLSPWKRMLWPMVRVPTSASGHGEWPVAFPVRAGGFAEIVVVRRRQGLVGRESTPGRCHRLLPRARSPVRECSLGG